MEYLELKTTIINSMYEYCILTSVVLEQHKTKWLEILAYYYAVQFSREGRSWNVVKCQNNANSN